MNVRHPYDIHDIHDDTDFPKDLYLRQYKKKYITISKRTASSRQYTSHVF